MLFQELNRREADREAIRENAIKERIERQLFLALRPIFNRMARDLREVYPVSGLTPDPLRYRDEILEKMQKYMTRTGEIFSRNIRDGVSEKSIPLFETKQAEQIDIDEEEEDGIEDEVATAIAAFILLTSNLQLDYVESTNTSQMQESLVEAEAIIIARGDIPTPERVSAVASTSFKRKSNSRLPVIASQAVGAVESASKEIEADVINRSQARTVEGKPLNGNIARGWNAILDGQVRSAHATADETYMSNPIPTGQSFIVGGESLRYPRDPSGSAGNTINCRCQTTYVTIN